MAHSPRKPKFYFHLVKRSRKIILGAVIAGIVSGACSMGVIALINHVAAENFQERFSIFLSGFIGLILIRFVAGVLSKIMLIRLAQGVICELRLTLSRQILDSPLQRFEHIGIPRIMAALTDDIATLSDTFASIPVLCIDLSVIAACLVYLGWLSPQLLLITMGFVVVGVGSYRFLANRGLRRLARARQTENTLFEHFHAMTGGFKELKLNIDRQAEFFGEHLKKSAEDYKRQNIAAFKTFAFADGWGEVLFFVPVGLALFMLPQISAVPQQVLWGYVITIIYLIGPLGNIVTLLPGIGRSYVAIQNINSLELSLDHASAETCDYNPPHIAGKADWRELKLTGVCHTYRANGQESGFTVGPIDLNLYSGEIVFITGGNGSGKTTLAKLITGLYDAEKGDIFLDDIRITDQNKTWYSQHFSAIFADYYIFRTLMGIDRQGVNIKADAALTWLGLNGKVSIANGGFSTTALSSGQRKRLAMLTALLEDRQIYLFDEWAADQDAEFRELFYTELLPALKQRGKGVFVISHDERFFSAADRIIKLDYGKMACNRPLAVTIQN